MTVRNSRVELTKNVIRGFAIFHSSVQYSLLMFFKYVQLGRTWKKPFFNQEVLLRTTFKMAFYRCSRKKKISAVPTGCRPYESGWISKDNERR